MPIHDAFRQRLYINLPRITEHFGTPFHIYDEAGIRGTCRELKKAFSGIPGFREFFAVKALPNPAIMKIMLEEGFGFDCSSAAELLLSRQTGAGSADIMFTSNNTSRSEFTLAGEDGGCILNLDDISLIDKMPSIPELICFRYNPGDLRSGNEIIGNPMESKYGVSRTQITDAYRKAKGLGVRRFGIHTMLASNELNEEYMVETTRMLLDLIAELEKSVGICFEFINIGGGFGIPYRPEEKPFNITAMARKVTALFTEFRQQQGHMPALYMESGRYMTGPHGVLVVKAINRKEIYRTYIGVDASMSALMRPALYGAYHHIDVLGKEESTDTEIVDIVGALCENNDKFAIQRELPRIVDGDTLIIHDTGAHGHAMGFNYNGRLRPQELLLKEDGSVALIRRAETEKDYFSTLHYDENILV